MSATEAHEHAATVTVGREDDASVPRTSVTLADGPPAAPSSGVPGTAQSPARSI
jgi:hypothetical protein